MAAVPQKTLNWLYNVLSREYRDPNRTYSDLAHTLARYPALAPRTDVFTFENGSSALLAHLVGTIPVTFRGATYRFPIALWIPHSYPYEAPYIYVTPTDEMAVRPGQHVGGDGRVYHHYLAHWGEAWDKSNVVDFLSILSEVFAKEPPVISRQQSPRQPMSAHNTSTPPPVPPPPRELRRDAPQTYTQTSTPSTGPPPPKKEPLLGQRGSTEPSTPSRYAAPPPLPSPNPKSPVQSPYYSQGNGDVRRPLSGADYQPQRSSSLRQQMQPQPQLSHDPRKYQRSQFGHPAAPVSLSQSQPATYSQQSQIPPPGRGGYPPQYNGSPQPPQFNGPLPNQQQLVPQGYVQQFHPQQQLPAPQKAPKVDLLDSPFDVTLPIASNLPAPPVPRNPEKDALLSAISTALTQTLHSSVAQNNAALPSLQAQHAALSNTYQTLETELANINALNLTLSSNVSILQSSLQQADSAIGSAKERAKRGDVPKVDEMLTAPMVVGKQLYDVVCEERGIEAGIRALQDGLVRGRIGADMWSRKTRELAREGFWKKVLAQKISTGMGLEGM